MNKTMTAAEVVAALEDGMTIGIGGWGARRKPMSLVREILRSPLKDLTVVSYGGPEIGLLCAAGKVRKLICGFVSLDLIPLDPHFRSARQAGSVVSTEIDEGMLQWGLRAAMLRLPFLPTRAGLATDVQSLNPDFKTVSSPYADGEVLLAMPALKLDAALVHVDNADAAGNGQVLGPDPYFDDLFCAAADKAYMSCERIVETSQFADLGCMHSMQISRLVTDGVVEAPFGAHPTCCTPRYGIDLDHLKVYAAAAKDDAAWQDYRSRFVDVDDKAYLEAVGGASRLEAIAAPIY